MIIDFHTHAFPDFLAPRAMESLAASSQYPPVLSGTVANLKSSMKEAGIDYSVVLNIATNAKQTANVNDFAIELTKADGIIPFGSVHPDCENIAAELARLKAAGVKGIKFHPDFQDFAACDNRMYKIYEKVAAYGFIMLFHCGKDLDPRMKCNCPPKEFARVARDFASAKIVGAHLGGQGMWSEVFEHVCGLDVYLDASYGFGLLTREQLKRFTDSHDGNKLLFGTDSPWQSQKHDAEMMKERVKDSKLYSKIMGENAACLLGLNA